ncbi:FAD binding domain-containing protein [Larkinella rosea]|uniref:Xanthine dehydrogenase family protein subunit M n=1 Tax=Larkinella rosea TaxID=2025312 RepID=A0A3P1C1X2_9BACT|nr:xanthine dehydrogenase family protein subunit M [Larkinella rosea]RRB07381.1 xanthine dehydrogenase family protein subunit M [Larkinella rosea]
MNNFSYSRPEDLNSALGELTKREGAKFIAGGTNLLDLMKENIERPSHLIDINHLGLNTIEATADGGLRLGALVTNADTAYHENVVTHYPLLSQAILAGASAQLRNMATNGGNLFQRTRCYYFYDLATPCNKREPGSGCGALRGYNRIHAILGTSDQNSETACIATHPSDMCVALAALEAVVRVTGPAGERIIPFADFHRLPGNEPWRDNTINPGELVTAIDLPPKGFSTNFAYIKLRDRTSYAFALVSVAVALEIENNRILDARVALGGVAHKPWRKPEVEATLIGQPVSEANFQAVAEALIDGAKGYGHNTFKIELAKRAIVRALQQAAKLEPTA